MLLRQIEIYVLDVRSKSVLLSMLGEHVPSKNISLICEANVQNFATQEYHSRPNSYRILHLKYMIYFRDLNIVLDQTLCAMKYFFL